MKKVVCGDDFNNILDLNDSVKQMWPDNLNTDQWRDWWQGGAHK